MRPWVLSLVCLLLLVIQPVHADIPTSLEIEIHELINDVRADKQSHGVSLNPLKLHSVLIDIARSHSEDMLKRQYFAHESPEGDIVSDRAHDAGIEYSSIGENLAWMQGRTEKEVADTAVDGWIKSPGHYANILTSYGYTGIGVATSGSEYYITQVFLSGDPGHLEEIGQIFNNDNLDNLSSEDTGGFQFTAELGAGIVIVLVILVGWDANRRNRKYYGRR